MAYLPIPHIIKAFPAKGHIMPYFKHTLVGFGGFCDANFTVGFSKKDVAVFLLRTKSSSQGGMIPHAPICINLHSTPTQAYCLPSKTIPSRHPFWTKVHITYPMRKHWQGTYMCP